MSAIGEVERTREAFHKAIGTLGEEQLADAFRSVRPGESLPAKELHERARALVDRADRASLRTMIQVAQAEMHRRRRST